MLPPQVKQALRDVGREIPRCDRVLVVDDEPDNLETLAMILEDQCTVSTAADGTEALVKLKLDGEVDLVISDQRMPGMEGVELLERIKKRAPDTIRILLTAFNDVEPMMDALNQGAVYRFILKPFDATEMRAIVRDALTLKTNIAAHRLLFDALVERRNELAEALDSLQRAQGQLVEAERTATLGRLIAGILHDLNNHASAFSMMLYDIRRSGRSSIQAAAERAWKGFSAHLELLQLIHSYARARSVEVERVSVSAEDFVATTLDLFNMSERGQRSRVLVQIRPGTEKLWIDETQARQALLALLDNAAIAAAEKTPILLELETADGEDLCIQVLDEGFGMDDRERQKADSPFYSGFDPPGLGVGLEIVRLVARCHGGHFELHSTPGEGTRAMLLLPKALGKGANR